MTYKQKIKIILCGSEYPIANQTNELEAEIILTEQQIIDSARHRYGLHSNDGQWSLEFYEDQIEALGERLNNERFHPLDAFYVYNALRKSESLFSVVENDFIQNEYKKIFPSSDYQKNPYDWTKKFKFDLDYPDDNDILKIYKDYDFRETGNVMIPFNSDAKNELVNLDNLLSSGRWGEHFTYSNGGGIYIPFEE